MRPAVGHGRWRQLSSGGPEALFPPRSNCTCVLAVPKDRPDRRDAHRRTRYRQSVRWRHRSGAAGSGPVRRNRLRRTHARGGTEPRRERHSPRTQVFYSQYQYVVGYYGVETFVDAKRQEGHDQRFGYPLAVYVTDYGDATVELQDDGYPVTDRPLPWIDATDAWFVVGSEEADAVGRDRRSVRRPSGCGGVRSGAWRRGVHVGGNARGVVRHRRCDSRPRPRRQAGPPRRRRRGVDSRAGRPTGIDRRRGGRRHRPGGHRRGAREHYGARTRRHVRGDAPDRSANHARRGGRRRSAATRTDRS